MTLFGRDTLPLCNSGNIAPESPAQASTSPEPMKAPRLGGNRL